MRYTFGGDQTVTYPAYLDGERGGALVARPGQTYDIEPTTGHTVLGEDGERRPLELAMPPDGNWKPEAKPAAAKKKES